MNYALLSDTRHTKTIEHFKRRRRRSQAFREIKWIIKVARPSILVPSLSSLKPSSSSSSSSCCLRCICRRQVNVGGVVASFSILLCRRPQAPDRNWNTPQWSWMASQFTVFKQSFFFYLVESWYKEEETQMIVNDIIKHTNTHTNTDACFFKECW